MRVNMEYLNVYDNNKNKLDKKIGSGDKLSNDEHILVAVIFIKNKDNKYLIQHLLQKGVVYIVQLEVMYYIMKTLKHQ